MPIRESNAGSVPVHWRERANAVRARAERKTRARTERALAAQSMPDSNGIRIHLTSEYAHADTDGWLSSP
jgi:hypothetical protein